MDNLKITFGFLFTVVLLGLIISGCGPAANPVPVYRASVHPSSLDEGQTFTATIEVYRRGSPGNLLTAEAGIAAIYLPKNFSLLNDEAYLWTNANPTWRLVKHATTGALADVVTVMERRLRASEKLDFYLSDGFLRLSSLEALGYRWWVGKTVDPVAMDGGDVAIVLATIESGGAGEIACVMFDCISLCSLEAPEYKGCNKYSVINPSSDTILGSTVGGIIIEDVSISVPDSGDRIYYGFQSSAARYLNKAYGYIQPTNFITVTDGQGNYLHTISLPIENPERNSLEYALKSVAAAGGRAYATCSDGGGTNNGDLRIYDSSGDEIAVHSLDGLGVENIARARVEGSVTRIYTYDQARDDLVVVTDYGASQIHTSYGLPFYGSSIVLLDDLRIVLAGENHVLVGNVAVGIDAYLTPEATSDHCVPKYYIDDQTNRRLYFAQALMNDSASHIWEINYGISPPTVEAVIDVGTTMGAFSIDEQNRKLYVPLPAEGNIVVVDVATFEKTRNTVSVGGVPYSTAFSSGKLYVGDIGILPSGDLLEYLIIPPQNYNDTVDIYTPSGMNITWSDDIEIGYMPSVQKIKGKLLAGALGVAGSAIHGTIWPTDPDSLIGLMNLSFESTAAPTIENVLIDGAVKRPGDYVYPNSVLTADLIDNTAIWGTSRVLVDGFERADAAFAPSLPSNNQSTVEMTVGDLGSPGPHTIRIEATDGAALTVHEIPGLIFATGKPEIGAGYPMAYPGVFRPLSNDPAKNTLILAYTLSADADIKVVIVDVTGRPVFTRSFRAGVMGGRLGYNEVRWNGVTDFGNTVGNGIYPYKILEGTKVLGDGKIVVYDE